VATGGVGAMRGVCRIEIWNCITVFIDKKGEEKTSHVAFSSELSKRRVNYHPLKRVASEVGRWLTVSYFP